MWPGSHGLRYFVLVCDATCSAVRAFERAEFAWIFQLYHSNSLEPRLVDSVAKSDALRRNFYACAFSAAAEETPIRENSAAFGASLYLQSGDLHFGLQVRVGSLCLAVGAARTFCSRAPDMAPRTEWGCHPVAAVICSIVAPLGRLSIAIMEVSLPPASERP